MQRTTNYDLKKPDRTDAALIDDINDNMDILDEELSAPTGDSKDSTVTFTSSDVADGSATAWTSVAKVNSGEMHKSLFAKMSQMFKNIRFLYKLLGTKDISSIGDGTVTGGLSLLNDSLAHALQTYNLPYSQGGTSALYYDRNLINRNTVTGIFLIAIIAKKQTNSTDCWLGLVRISPGRNYQIVPLASGSDASVFFGSGNGYLYYSTSNSAKPEYISELLIPMV